MVSYAFWNNKGGTGKTSLAFQVICAFANANPDKKILVVDVCPQANLSELMLGGLTHGGSENLLLQQQKSPRSSIGGYFQLRLPSPFTPVVFDPSEFIIAPARFNANIPKNIELLCGDPLLELQTNAISTLANTQLPGSDTWLKIIDWIKDFINATNDKYSHIFFDLNPSFSIHSQIALAACDKVILPVMADDSSRRAIQNAFSLIYGLSLPSPIYSKHAFAHKLMQAERTLPKVHLIIKNRLTQYMGPATAYSAVLTSIDNDIKKHLKDNPHIFTFDNISDAVFNVRDFQTTGVVAFARGNPFYSLQPGSKNIMGQRVAVKEDYLNNCIEVIDNLIKKF